MQNFQKIARLDTAIFTLTCWQVSTLKIKFAINSDFC